MKLSFIKKMLLIMMLCKGSFLVVKSAEGVVLSAGAKRSFGSLLDSQAKRARLEEDFSEKMAQYVVAREEWFNRLKSLALYKQWRKIRNEYLGIQDALRQWEKGHYRRGFDFESETDRINRLSEIKARGVLLKKYLADLYEALLSTREMIQVKTYDDLINRLYHLMIAGLLAEDEERGKSLRFADEEGGALEHHTETYSLLDSVNLYKEVKDHPDY